MIINYYVERMRKEVLFRRDEASVKVINLVRNIGSVKYRFRKHLK
jgi:hypothetical protein